jgi:hypothetical protein
MSIECPWITRSEGLKDTASSVKCFLRLFLTTVKIKNTSIARPTTPAIAKTTPLAALFSRKGDPFLAVPTTGGAGDAAAAIAGVEVTTTTDVPPLGSATKEVITAGAAVKDGVSDELVDNMVEEDKLDVVDNVEVAVVEGTDEVVTDATVDKLAGLLVVSGVVDFCVLVVIAAAAPVVPAATAAPVAFAVAVAGVAVSSAAAALALGRRPLRRPPSVALEPVSCLAFRACLLKGKMWTIVCRLG